MNLASDAKITQTVPAALQAVAQMTPLQAQQILNKHLPFSGLYLLAAPSTPKQAVEEVVAKAEAGERMSVVEIKSTIAEAKAKGSGHVRQPKLPSYIPAEKHNVPNTEGADKSAKAVTPEDTALFAFTERVLDLIRRVGNHVPDRFARTAVKAHDLAELGKFFTELAELLKADGASQPVSSLEDEVVF